VGPNPHLSYFRISPFTKSSPEIINLLDGYLADWQSAAHFEQPLVLNNQQSVVHGELNRRTYQQLLPINRFQLHEFHLGQIAIVRFRWTFSQSDLSALLQLFIGSRRPSIGKAIQDRDNGI